MRTGTARGERYAYDLCGNRLLKEQYSGGSVDVTEGYRYNERNELTERIRAGSLTVYRYDKNGSIVSEEEEGRRSEYRYDLLNRQTYVRTLDGKEQENSYDGEGLRAGITENGKRTTFLYHNGEILTECDGESAPIKRYLRGIGLSHVQTIQDNTCYSYHQDEQGSTVYVIGQGKTENIYQYDAFGNLLENKEELTNRILYTGQQYDQETGQYYLRARYYNPVVGRFLQEDSYRGDGLNLYAYCANNPVVYFDPSGLNKCPDNQPEIKKTPGTDAVPESLLQGDANTRVYLGMKDGKRDYVGITTDIDRRQRQHGDRFDYLDEITTEPLTRRQARAIEQAMIENNEQFSNKINSIKDTREWYDDAKKWGEAWLREHGFLE